MKLIFRLIGMLVVFIVLVMALLCYLDTKDLLSGKVGGLVTVLRRCGNEAWSAIMVFLGDSGIAQDAADLLDQGANYLRNGVTPHKTDKPGSHALPEGYLTPSPVPTATPVPTASPVPTATPEAMAVS